MRSIFSHPGFKASFLRFPAAVLMLYAAMSCHRLTPQEQVHQIMIDRSVTLATAESCTGGTIAARFTALPGASAYFKYGIVAYSNDAKRNILGVEADTIGRYGVVSEKIARQMAEGARRISHADYAVATTGIAGPTGGTPEQPVGTVYIAVATPIRTVSKKIHAGSRRAKVVDRASQEAIQLLLDELKYE